jgi:hypothetical protein
VNSTMIATAASRPSILKLCRFLLWLPTIVMAFLTIYGIFIWITRIS